MKNVYFFSMYFLFVVVYLKEFSLLSAQLFTPLASLGIVILLIASLSMTRGFQFYVSLISLSIGHIILLSYNLGFNIWYESFVKSLGIPILFVVIPMVALPIKYGAYLQSIEGFVRAKKDKPVFLFSLLAIIHLALSIILNIGSIPTMQKLLAKVQFSKKYLAHLYTAGYSSYMVFSPYDGVVNMVLLFTSLTYGEYFIAGASMAVLIVLLSSLVMKADREPVEEAVNRLSASENNGSNKKTYELLIHIFMLIILASVGNTFLPFSNQLYIIAAIIVFYSLFWGLLINALTKYKNEVGEYSQNLLNFKTFIPFLLSTSFLGSMVSYTPLKGNIGNLLLSLEFLPLYVSIQLFILLTVALSLCGVHMMITVTTLALTVTPEFVGLTDSAFALTLLSCWYVAMSISPFVPFSVIVGDTIGEKPVTVTLKYNLKFSLAMIILAPLLILVINYF